METLASTAPSTQLDEDVMMSAMMNTDMLMNLPLKSIGRFRCVSKRWRDYLKSPKFIKDHLNFRRTDDPEYIISSWYGNMIAPYLTSLTPGIGTESDAVTTKVPIPSSWELSVAGSCNGLVLLKNESGFRNLVLSNPITLESVLIFASRSFRGSAIGLGYDASSDDYKIVAIDDSLVNVYSVRNKLWKKLGRDNPYHPYSAFYRRGSLFLNGRVHWVYKLKSPDSEEDSNNEDANNENDEEDAGSNNDEDALDADVCSNDEDALDEDVCSNNEDAGFKNKGAGGFKYRWGGFRTEDSFGVAALDVAREVIEQVAVPDGVFGFNLGVIDGCLALATKPKDFGDDPKFVDVWVMKEYGVKESWIKVASIECGERINWVENVHFVDEHEVFVINDFDHKMVAYNWRSTREARDVVVDGAPRRFSFSSSMNFKGSLVSPIYTE